MNTINPKQTLQTIIQTILHCYPDVVAIYCFGSFGTIHENKESDIDLAILPSKKINPLERYQLAQKISYLVKREVDLIDLLSAKTFIQFQVVHTGNRIYCADPEKTNFFEDRIFLDYLEMQELCKELF